MIENETPAIELERVSKYYGPHVGLDDVSMRIPRGAFVGLLGPNGAGKTTAIRVLTCYMPPSSGTARVCGHDVLTQTLQAQRCIGYLPESCPLYRDMRVMDYLRWMCALRGITGSDVERAIFKVAEPCGIMQWRQRTIRELSKGYRQRVGLASAMLHEPELLILDEPTVGLDPLQVKEFRAMLGRLKGMHTVLISSHVLSEIEMLCDSVIIMHQGRVVAAGSPDELRAQTRRRYRVECVWHKALPVLLPKLMDRLAGATLDAFEEDGATGILEISCVGPDPRRTLAHLLNEAGLDLIELHAERVSLEDVFVDHIRGEISSPPEKATAADEPAEAEIMQ
jgi:ABC-2 type transport system ATP-binding protein